MKHKLSPLAWLLALPAFVILISLACIDPEVAPTDDEVAPTDYYEPSPTELAAQGVQLIEEIYGGNHIGIQGNYALVGTYKQLIVVDISSPAALRVTGLSDPLPDVILDLVLIGDYAYVANGRGFAVVNIAHAAPYEVSNTSMEDVVSKIAISGYYAYLFESFTGLRVMDISDPYHPQRVGLFEARILLGELNLVGNTAYLTDDEYGLMVIDISQPDRPHQVAEYKRGMHIEALAAQGDYVFVSDSDALLRALDATFPTDIVERDFISKKSTGSVIDILISDGFAYILDTGAHLQIVDITDPDHLRLVSIFELRDNTQAIAISEGYAYLSGQYNGMTVVDISDPFNPTVVMGH